MSLLKYLFILLFCCFTYGDVWSQFVNYGTDPARLKWDVVKTKHYKLIFPQDNYAMAYRYATLLENVYPYVKNTMQPQRDITFPSILHTNNMLSNGMVAWAPRRMELITTPPADIYAQSWDKQLVIHELRHVVQLEKLSQGTFRWLYYLIGEQSMGFAAFFVPRWFFEGDAVVSETAFTNSGRGRLPEFNMAYRAQMLSGKNYSFDKWFLGSYKNYTGNFYAMGYNMTAYARYQYGANVWDKVIDSYTKKIFVIPPFSSALKRHTGLTPKKLFDETYSFLYNEWKQLDSVYQKLGIGNIDGFKYLSPEPKYYTSYKYPQSLTDSTVIAVKSGLRDINSLVILNNGCEERLSYLGNISSGLKLSNGRVYWTEYVSGIRWTHENYSVLKYYDFASRKINTLTPRKRYLSPAISSDGDLVAVSQPNDDGTNQIVLVNSENGNEVSQFDVPANAFVKDLTFSENGNIIVTAVIDEGICFLQLDSNTGEWTGLKQPSPVNITMPTYQKGKLFFESGLNGTNNIYYFDTLRLRSYQLTNSRFGAFAPTLSQNGKQLLFSDYQASGYRVASVPIDSLKAEVIDFSQPYRFELAETVGKQELINLDTVKFKPIKFEPKPYRRWANLFKIHSWAPFYYDVADAMNMQSDDFTSMIKPGATIISQNTLNTAITQASWYYNKGYHHGKLSFIYTGWYPVIDLNVDYGGKSFDAKWEKDKDNESRYILRSNNTNNNLIEAEARIYIPFNFTRNHYVRGFQPSISYYYTNNSFQQFNTKKSRDYQYMLSELRYYNYRKLAQRDILPRWGYQIRLQYLNTPFDTENFGELYATRLTTYFPGLIRNHGLMLRLGYQYQDTKTIYSPKQLLDSPRGYNYEFRTQQQLAFKADYSFSLFNPDFSIGSLAYVKRIRANLFYDLSRNQASKNAVWTNQSSFGGDLLFDWNVIRAEFPLTFGIRIVQPIDYGKLQAQMLFSISL